MLEHTQFTVFYPFLKSIVNVINHQSSLCTINQLVAPNSQATPHTVCGYKFNHMATKLPTLTPFESPSLKGPPVLLEGWLENKIIRQNTNKEASF